MESSPDGDPLKVRIGLVLQKIDDNANHPIPEGITEPELDDALAKDAALEAEIDETAHEARRLIQ